jgi:hypothetical protein
MGSGEAIVDRIAGVYYLNLGLYMIVTGKKPAFF